MFPLSLVWFVQFDSILSKFFPPSFLSAKLNSIPVIFPVASLTCFFPPTALPCDKTCLHPHCAKKKQKKKPNYSHCDGWAFLRKLHFTHFRYTLPSPQHASHSTSNRPPAHSDRRARGPRLSRTPQRFHVFMIHTGAGPASQSSVKSIR